MLTVFYYSYLFSNAFQHSYMWFCIVVVRIYVLLHTLF